MASHRTERPTCTYAAHWIMAVAIVSFGINGVWADICYGPVCRYELNITLSRTMRDSNNNQVFLNGTQLQTVDANGHPVTVSPDDVVIADGFIRDVILCNGKLPGPTIEVMKGVQLVIKVNNLLRQKATMVHWHGMQQLNTYYMDGAEDISQCPILPHRSFTYEFIASPAGTHWYHSHQSMMRLDGLFGLLIVHDTPPVIPYFPIAVNDWNHVLSEQLEQSAFDLCENGARSPPLKPINRTNPDCSFEGAEVNPTRYISSLFDGRNRWENQSFPLKEYIVEPGQRYRVRMVNTGHNYPFQIQIDQHPLIIVGSEASDIEPIPVDSFFIFVAESIDFEFVANQAPGRYWFRADTQCTGAYAYGIIVYKGFENTKTDPTSVPKSCTNSSPCTVFNCPFERYPPGYNRTCIPIDAGKSTLSSSELSRRFGLGDSSPVHELFMNYGMNAGPVINGWRFKMPEVALFHNQSAVSGCVGEPCVDSCKCSCTHIVELPFGRTIRLIVSNLQPNRDVVQAMYHTVHMHGHEFAVLAEKFPVYDPITGRVVNLTSDIVCESDLCAHPRWSNASPDFSHINNSVIKDSVVIPVSGYVVLQFVTNNPGFLAFHCHVDQHMMSGMTMVFKVSHPNYGLPKVPQNFPTCHDFELSEPSDKAIISASATSSLLVVCILMTSVSWLRDVKIVDRLISSAN